MSPSILIVGDEEIATKITDILNHLDPSIKDRTKVFVSHISARDFLKAHKKHKHPHVLSALFIARITSGLTLNVVMELRARRFVSPDDGKPTQIICVLPRMYTSEFYPAIARFSPIKWIPYDFGWEHIQHVVKKPQVPK